MSRRYFSNKKSRDPNLLRIIIAICLVAAGAYGLYRVVGYLSLGSYVGPGSPPVEASTDGGGLGDAREKLESGDNAAAREIAQAVLEGDQDPAVVAEATNMLVEMELARNDPQKALTIIEQYRASHQDTADHPQIALRYARVLEQLERFDEAKTVYANVRDRAPAALRAEALGGLARQEARDGNNVEARNLFREALNTAAWGDPVWEEALDGLGDQNIAIIFAPQQVEESKVYEVASGDSLTSIGIKLNTTQGLLMRANGIEDPSVLRLGQRLKYTPKDFRVLIERSTCRLYLLDNDGIFKRYHVGLGMPGYETTLGKYTIGNKQKDPVWFKPGAGPVPAGDPENELGTRWMPLIPVEEGLPTDLGIHGTIAPETIGQYKSHGCPRLRTPEVEELYDLIVRSTPAEIVETIDWTSLGAPQGA